MIMYEVPEWFPIEYIQESINCLNLLYTAPDPYQILQSGIHHKLILN